MSTKVSCGGWRDFNGVNGFTLGDSIFVGAVWAEEELWPWQKAR